MAIERLTAQLPKHAEGVGGHLGSFAAGDDLEAKERWGFRRMELKREVEYDRKRAISRTLHTKEHMYR